MAKEYTDLFDEIWRDIPGWEGKYQVSSIGRVKNTKKNKILKPKLTKDGYYEFSLYSHSIYKYIRAHRLVAQAFIPNPDNKPFINHIDSDRLNNCVSNLEWCTQGENMKHGFLHGNKTQKGEFNNQAKINSQTVLEIRKMHSSGNYTQQAVANHFSLRREHIKDIVNRKIWKHI